MKAFIVIVLSSVEDPDQDLVGSSLLGSQSAWGSGSTVGTM